MNGDDHDHDHEQPQQMSAEEFEDLMPDQSPPLIMRLLYMAVGVVTFAMLFAPAAMYFLHGIEASVAFFLTGVLIVLVQR